MKQYNNFYPTKNLICRKLETTKYCQIGAKIIAYELSLLGKEPPAIWVTNRVLASHNMVRKTNKEKYEKKDIEYPYFREAKHLNYIHQADFVGPRYIKDGGRFYSFNTIDLFSHKLSMHPLRYRDDYSTGKALVECWKYLGIPDYLQLDNNAATFHGSNRNPRQFWYIPRLCLIMGIEPVFIPIKEPWRNGAIEKFNHTYDSKFFRAQRFNDYEHLVISSNEYNSFHNNNYVYSCLKSRTPNQVVMESQVKPALLFEDYQAPKGIKFIPAEIIYVIRFIRSDCTFNLFGEKFKVPGAFKYSYLQAAIKTDEDIMQLYSDDALIEKYDCKLKE